MPNYDQTTMGLVGVLSAGVALTTLVGLVVIGGYGIWTGLFIGVLLGLVVAIVLLRVVHRDADPAAAPAPAAKPAAAAAPSPAAAEPGGGAGSKPAMLSAARDGGPDDLKKIKGVGPKLEELLHGMGIYHFDQIAGWTEAEVAWVDENLEGFKGRVSRDDWVSQARTLARGGETAFSKKVDEGGVY